MKRSASRTTTTLDAPARPILFAERIRNIPKLLGAIMDYIRGAARPPGGAQASFRAEVEFFTFVRGPFNLSTSVVLLVEREGELTKIFNNFEIFTGEG